MSGLTLTGPAGQVVGRVACVVQVVRPDGRVEQVAADAGRRHEDDGSVLLAGTRGTFAATARWGPPSTPAGRREVRLEVTHRGDGPVAASLRLEVRLAADDADPWWLVPGAFYGENRPAACDRRFPRFEVGADDPAGMVSDHWELRADRAATPAVLGWSGPGGVALLAGETSALGMTGLGLRHDAEHGASVHLTFPFREDPVSYDGSGTPAPAEAATYTWRPGEAVVVDLVAYGLGPDRHGYAAVLREHRERTQPEEPVRPWVDVAEAAEIAAEGLVRWHYDPDPGVLLETVGFDREVTGRDGRSVDRQAMHVGWVSGIPWAYALLAHARRTGDAAQAAAAVRVVDFICSELSPSGTFWGVWYRDSGWSQSWSPVRHTLHGRTLGEATLFLLRALREEQAGEQNARPAWTAAARSNLDAVVRRQRDDGNLGSTHHALTGEVLLWEGAAGLTWVAALAEAGDLDGPGGAAGAYLRAAERAGAYYARFVDAEYLHGAPEDVDLAPSSEDGYAAVLAYVALHRRTRDRRWLDLARRAADWTLTFRYSYDVTFAPRTLLGTYGFATRGADQASPSNQHLHAYGLVCTAELVELSAALEDDYYRERAVETLACFRQLVPRADGEVNSYRGMITERYYQTACFQPKGMLLTLSHAWSVGVLLLGCEQAVRSGLPGPTEQGHSRPRQS